MAFLIASLLVILCIALVAYPFLGKHYLRNSTFLPHSLQELRLLRQSLYEEIERLKMDVDVGQVTQQEYEDRVRDLRHWAAATLRKEHQVGQDHHEADGGLDRALEEEIARLRRSQASLQARERGADLPTTVHEDP